MHPQLASYLLFLEELVLVEVTEDRVHHRLADAALQMFKSGLIVMAKHSLLVVGVSIDVLAVVEAETRLCILIIILCLELSRTVDLRVAKVAIGTLLVAHGGSAWRHCHIVLVFAKRRRAFKDIDGLQFLWGVQSFATTASSRDLLIESIDILDLLHEVVVVHYKVLCIEEHGCLLLNSAVALRARRDSTFLGLLCLGFEIGPLLKMKVFRIIVFDLVHLHAVLDLKRVDQELPIRWELDLVSLEQVMSIPCDERVPRLQQVKLVEIVVSDVPHGVSLLLWRHKEVAVLVVQLADALICVVKIVEEIVDAQELRLVVADGYEEPGALDLVVLGRREPEQLFLPIDDKSYGGQLLVEEEDDHVKPLLALFKGGRHFLTIDGHLKDGFGLGNVGRTRSSSALRRLRPRTCCHADIILLGLHIALLLLCILVLFTRSRVVSIKMICLELVREYVIHDMDEILHVLLFSWLEWIGNILLLGRIIPRNVLHDRLLLFVCVESPFLLVFPLMLNQVQHLLPPLPKLRLGIQHICILDSLEHVEAGASLLRRRRLLLLLLLTSSKPAHFVINSN